MKKQKTMKKKIQFFNSQGFTTSFSTAMFCLCLIAFTELANGDDWPNWMGPTNDGVWHEKGILETFPESGAKYVWRVPIGKGYTGPAVVDGKLYVMDRVEKPKSENDADGEDEKKNADQLVACQSFLERNGCSVSIAKPGKKFGNTNTNRSIKSATPKVPERRHL